MDKTAATRKSNFRTFTTLCGRVFRDTDPQYFPCAQFKGRKIYFCTDSCLSAFQADPELFYKTHGASNKEQRQAPK
jgi:YHS domain-containing protein